MLNSEKRSTAPRRSALRPPMFCMATNARAAPPIAIGTVPSPRSDQKTVRYSEMATAPIAITIR
jgi:hypothetical protein